MNFYSKANTSKQESNHLSDNQANEASINFTNAQNSGRPNFEPNNNEPNNCGKNIKAQRLLECIKNEKSAIKMLNIDTLTPYSDHPFKLYGGERLNDMVTSITEFGVLSPIIVRTTAENMYEILSGHNRVNAAKLARHSTVPAIIKNNLTDNEARLIVTETNLQQRSFSDLTHSERALCLKQHYEAIKCQGKRNNLINEIESLLNPNQNITSVQVEHKQISRDKLGNKYGLSPTNVTRYIRLSSLIPELLELVDIGKIAFLTAYQLSFIEDTGLQNQIFEYLHNNFKLDIKKAEILRQYYENNILNNEMLMQVFSELSVTKTKPFTIKPEIIEQYFTTEQSKNEIEETIINALQFYYNYYEEEKTEENEEECIENIEKNNC